MSIKVMSWVWESVELKAAHKLVLLSLADNANDDGVCWPSITTIARKCGLNDRYVKRILSELKEAGLISITYRRDGTINKSNVYTVHWGSIVPHPGGAETPTPEGIQTPTPGGVQAPTLGAQESPDPSLNRKSFNRQIEPPAEAVAAAGSQPNKPDNLKLEMLKLLYDAGIWSPTAHEIVDLPHITPEYLKAKIAEALAEKVNVKILITRLRNNDPLPPTPEQREASQRKRYAVPGTVH